jgi:hypothetical protein
LTDSVRKQKLLELAERAENSKKPERQLDTEIAATAFNLNPGRSTSKEEVGPWEYLHPNGRHIFAGQEGDGRGPMLDYGDKDEWGGFNGWDVFSVPPFTSSIDAAMVLVPKELEDWQLADLLEQAMKRWFLSHNEENDGDAKRERIAPFITAAALRSIAAA